MKRSVLMTMKRLMLIRLMILCLVPMDGWAEEGLLHEKI